MAVKIKVNGAKSLIEKVMPRDVIAVVILFLLFVLKLRGINGKVDIAIALIIGYYFSKRVYEEKNNKE